jgi:hypothetical protein
MNEKNSKITKIIAYIGTILVWSPIAFMIVTSIIGSIASQRFLMDILMPAELFLIIVAGTILLLWSAIRSKMMIKNISWTFLIMVLSLFGSQALAVLTGLAHGDTEPEGWPLLLVMFLMAVYIATVITEGLLGIMIRKGIKKST